jgi:hypothetical protein
MARPYVPPPAARPLQPPPAQPTSRWAILLPATGVAVVVGIVLLFVVLPIVLRSRCMAMAGERGIALTIDHVDIGLGDFRLVKIGFSLEGVPQLSAHADDALVTLSGMSFSGLAVDNLAVSLDGPVDEVQRSLDAWHASRAGGVGGGPGIKVTFGQAHLTWARPFGATAKMESADVAGEVDPAAGALRATAEHLTLTAGASTFGPWRTTLERDAQTTRTNIELDPVVHGGPSVLYVRSPAGTVSVNAKIPSSPLSRLGFPAKALHLGSDATVEAQLAFDDVVGGAATLTSSLGLTHAVFSGFPVDVAVKMRAVGDVTKGLDVREGSLKAGPLNASLNGTIKLFEDGARLNLGWTARPIPCAEVGKQLATQALGGLGQQLGALAQDVGGIVGLRVTGDAQASGLITLDTRDASATSFGMTTNETCGLALF